MRPLIILLFTTLGAVAPARSQDPILVSMIQLISTPREFDGKRVIVTGFARIEFEGNGLFFHKDDLDYGLVKNALWLVVPRGTESGWEKVSGGYALVEGTFSAQNTGHMGMYSGAIKDITRFQSLPRYVAPAASVPPNKSLERTRER